MSTTDAEQERRRIGVEAARQWLITWRAQKSHRVNSEQWWRHAYQMGAFAHIACEVCGLGTPDDVSGELPGASRRSEEFLALPELAGDRDLRDPVAQAAIQPAEDYA